MTKSKSIKKSKGNIFWVRDRKTKITVFRKEADMKVRKGSEVDEEALKLDNKNERFILGMSKGLANNRAASICSVCNSSLSIHKNEKAC